MAIISMLKQAAMCKGPESPETNKSEREYKVALSSKDNSPEKILEEGIIVNFLCKVFSLGAPQIQIVPPYLLCIWIPNSIQYSSAQILPWRSKS